MRIRTLVSSTALVSALFAVSMPANPAFAQQSGGVLSPSSDWAVTEVDDQSGAYCAMARRYNRDTVMTIAQNGNTETSFALDFQRPLLQTGQTMSVVLDAGAGQQRFYEVRPVSGRAFVVRLGRDDSFFNALTTTGMLRVEVAGRSYHFSLADFGAGQDKLGSCVAAMVMPAAGEETEAPLAISAAAPASVPVPAPAASGEGASYRQEINALRKQIAELTQKNAEAGAVAAPAPVDPATEAQLAALRQENEDLRGKLDEAKSEAAQQVSVQDAGDKAALEALRGENGQLQSELAALRQKAEAAPAAGGRTPEVEKEIADLRIENQRLGDALMEATKGDLKAEMEGLRAKNQALVTELEAARQKTGSDSEGKLAALEARNRELESSLEGKADNTKLLEELRGRISAMENENRTLKDEASRLAAAGTQEKDSALSEAGRKNEEKIAALQADIDSLKLEGEEKDRKLLEAGQGASEVQALKQETKALREQLATAEGKGASIEGFQARIQVLEEENKTLKAALALAETESEIAAQDTKISEDSRVEIEKLAAENAALSKDLETARAESGDVATLKKELSALQTENLELEMAASEAAAPVLEEGSADDLAILREENAQLQEKLKEKDERLAKMEKKQGELSEQVRVAEKSSASRKADAESRAVSKQAAVSKAGREPVQGDLFEAPVAVESASMESRGSVQQKARAEQPAVSYSAKEESEPSAEPIVLAQAEAEEISQGRAADVSAAEALNEAQLQDIAMREKIGRVAPAAPVEENKQAAQVGAEPLAARTVQDPFEKSAVSAPPILQEVPSGEQVAAKVAPADAGMKAASSSSSPVGAYSPVVAVPDLLARASLVQPAAVERVERASGPERAAYEWREGGIYGTAEQRPMGASANFDELVKDYLMRAQTRCPGQFAVVPDDSVDGQGGRMDSYEIACVGDGVSSGASLLFFDRSGTFTVVAHEAPTQDLEAAMGYRDQVKKALSEAPVSDRVF